MTKINKEIEKSISSLKIVSVWLELIRNEQDLTQAKNKIDEVIKTLEKLEVTVWESI